MPNSYDFRDRFRMSQGISNSDDIAKILLANVPGAVNVRRANQVDDRNGVDYWIDLTNRKSLAVDIKVRQADWAQRGKDDLALEVWSVIENQTVGWTLNHEKHTDYVLWFWADTKRWCLIPFHLLVKVFAAHQKDWTRDFQTSIQATTGPAGTIRYHSQCVFVPRIIVWTKIYRMFGGTPTAAVQPASQATKLYYPP